MFGQIPLAAVLSIKRRVDSTEAGKPIKRLLLITQASISGGWGQGRGRDDEQEPQESWKWLEGSSSIQSDPTGGF